MQKLMMPRIENSDFLISNVCVDLKIAPVSDTGVSAGSHLTGTGVNFCGIEYGEIDNECFRTFTNCLQKCRL